MAEQIAEPTQGSSAGPQARQRVHHVCVCQAVKPVLGDLRPGGHVHEDSWPLNTSLWVKEFRLSKPAHAYCPLGTLTAQAPV